MEGIAFRKKPVVIQAVRWYGDNIDQVFSLNPDFGSLATNPDDSLQIPTLEGEMTAQVGDWIIRGVQGEIYPCKPDIFDATYERLCRSCSEPTGDNTDEGDVCNACIELEDPGGV